LSTVRSAHVVTELIIELPVGVVATHAVDPENAPIWYKNIDSAQSKTPPPLQVGSEVAFVARFLGRHLACSHEITELVAGERLVIATAECPFPMQTAYTWEAVSQGSTRMTLRKRGEPSGFSKVAAPFMSPAMRRANKKDLAQLRRILLND
jgi:hypothetical protein